MTHAPQDSVDLAGLPRRFRFDDDRVIEAKFSCPAELSSTIKSDVVALPFEPAIDRAATAAARQEQRCARVARGEHWRHSFGVDSGDRGIVEQFADVLAACCGELVALIETVGQTLLGGCSAGPFRFHFQVAVPRIKVAASTGLETAATRMRGQKIAGGIRGIEVHRLIVEVLFCVDLKHPSLVFEFGEQCDKVAAGTRYLRSTRVMSEANSASSSSEMVAKRSVAGVNVVGADANCVLIGLLLRSCWRHRWRRCVRWSRWLGWRWHWHFAMAGLRWGQQQRLC